MKEGALKGNSPAEVVGQCDITFSCVSDPQALKDVSTFLVIRFFVRCLLWFALVRSCLEQTTKSFPPTPKVGCWFSHPCGQQVPVIDPSDSKLSAYRAFHSVSTQLVFGNCGVLQGIVGSKKSFVDMSTVDVETVIDIHDVSSLQVPALVTGVLVLGDDLSGQIKWKQISSP